RGLAVGRGPGDLVAAVLPRRPVPRHADVAAVLPAYLRLSVRRGTVDGHREAVGAVPETARAGLTGENRPRAVPRVHTDSGAGRRVPRRRDPEHQRCRTGRRDQASRASGTAPPVHRIPPVSRRDAVLVTKDGRARRIVGGAKGHSRRGAWPASGPASGARIAGPGWWVWPGKRGPASRAGGPRPRPGRAAAWRHPPPAPPPPCPAGRPGRRGW